MSTEQIIVEFSKAAKVSRAKAQAFADSILQYHRENNPVKSGGRPVSDQTIRLRDSVVSAVETLQNQGKKATTDTIAGIIGGSVNKVYLCNALNWAEGQGKLQRIGKDDSKVGKGKKPILWGIK